MESDLAPLLIAVRMIHFSATMTVAGVVSFLTLVIKPISGCMTSQSVTNFRKVMTRIIWVALATTAVSGFSWLAILAANVSGNSITEALSGGTAGMMLTETQFGYDWIVRLLLCISLALCIPALTARRRKSVSWLGTASAIALVGSLAWSGHAGASPGWKGDLHRISDVLHLVAAGMWLGGLLPFAMVLVQKNWGASQTSEVTATQIVHRFSTIALVCVSVLLVSGIINSWMLVGNIPSLVETDYGRVLIVKVIIFIAMIVVAAFNRLLYTPALPNQLAQICLQRNAYIEIALGLAVVLAVSVLGILPPANMMMHLH